MFFLGKSYLFVAANSAKMTRNITAEVKFYRNKNVTPPMFPRCTPVTTMDAGRISNAFVLKITHSRLHLCQTDTALNEEMQVDSVAKPQRSQRHPPNQHSHQQIRISPQGSPKCMKGTVLWRKISHCRMLVKPQTARRLVPLETPGSFLAMSKG